MIIEKIEENQITGEKHTTRVEISDLETKDLIKKLKMKGGRLDRIRVVWTRL